MVDNIYFKTVFLSKFWKYVRLQNLDLNAAEYS